MSLEDQFHLQTVSPDTIHVVRELTNPVLETTGYLFDQSQLEFGPPIINVSKEQKKIALTPDDHGGAFDF